MATGTQSATQSASTYIPTSSYQWREQFGKHGGKFGTQSAPPLINFTDEFYDLIDEIKSPIVKSLMEIEKSPIVRNGLRIEIVDISAMDWNFDITSHGRKRTMKIGQFIRYFFSDTFSNREIFNFCKQYNALKRSDGDRSSDDSAMIRSEDYSKRADPKDIRSTFISLVTETYPHGHEEGVMKFMPPGLTKDQFGNYYKIIGKSETMFTSHLDTADREKEQVSLISYSKDGDQFIATDGSTILGADDKSGVTVMIYMMEHDIPGVYYFFIGEERGGIGSRQVADVYQDIPHLKGLKRCISFDRRNYHSVITSQMGRDCCSDEFAGALCKELNSHGLKMSLDPTGIYTDSANFVDDIGECTNISVGYFNEHMSDEHQNMTFLEKLCNAAIKVNWESLPSVRRVGFNEYIIKKYRRLIIDVKSAYFNSEVKVIGGFDQAFIRMKLEEMDIETTFEDLLSMSVILNKYKFDPDIYFEDDSIKIELK